MGRRPKPEQDSIKSPLMNEGEFLDDFTKHIYSAFVKARNTSFAENSFNQATVSMQNTCTIQLDGSVFVHDGIVFSTAFAKQQVLFTNLPSFVQHEQIKSAVIEMCVLAEAIRNQTEYFIARHSGRTEVSVITKLQGKGKTLSQKLFNLEITPVELSLVLALALYCSDRRCSASDVCKRLGSIEESILSALKLQIVKSHSKPMNILSSIIEILCSLRALTTQYLDELLSLDIFTCNF